MGKICDPPSFTGGQCVGVKYKLLFKATVIYSTVYYVSVGSIHYQFARGVGAQLDGFPGELTSIGTPYKNGLVWRFDVNSSTYGAFTATTDFNASNFYAGIIYSQPVLVSVSRPDGQIDNCGDPPPTNCRCSEDSCRVDCAGAPDGFCCIDHAVTNRLLQTLQG